MIYWNLFFGFLRVGLFAFGGAYGAIPMIRDIVRSYGWLSDEKLSYMIAVSESTPGPIMLNLATFVGQSKGGLIGAILATIAVILPAFFIILLITVSLKDFVQNQCVQVVLKGLKPCIAGIVLSTGMDMVISNCSLSTEDFAIDLQNVTMTFLLLILMMGTKCVLHKKLSPILLILISACFGVVMY